MLVLTRKEGESLTIGDGIVFTVLKLRTGDVSIGIEAPREVQVLRSELVARGGEQMAGDRNLGSVAEIRNCLIVGVLLSAATIPLIAGAEVKDHVDRFTGKREITYSTPARALQPTLIIAVVEKDAEQTAQFNVMTANLTDRRTGTAWRYLRCHAVAWLIDGAPATFAPALHDGTVIRGGVIETIRVPMTVADLAKLGAARSVEYRICSDEFSLTADDLAGIRDVLGRASGQPPAPTVQTPASAEMQYRPKF